MRQLKSLLNNKLVLKIFGMTARTKLGKGEEGSDSPPPVPKDEVSLLENLRNFKYIFCKFKFLSL